MAIVLPIRFQPLPPQNYAFAWPVKAGGGGAYGEQDIAENGHFLHGYLTPQIVTTLYNSDAGYVACSNLAAYEIRSIWRRKVFRDLTWFDVWFSASNTSAVQPGSVKFQMQSNAALNVVTAIPAGTAAWTAFSVQFAYDPAIAGGRDAVEMWMQAPNDAGKETRVRSVTIRPRALTAIGTGVSTEGLVPIDTAMYDQDSPLSTWLRDAEMRSCEVLRKTRADTFVGWGEDFMVRTPATYAALKTQSASWTTVARVPLATWPGQVAIEWALYGYRTGASGSVRFRTQQMAAAGTWVTQVLGAAWATPYAGAQYDDTGSTLSVDGQMHEVIEVQLISDGAGWTYLMGLSMWAKDIV